MLLHASSALSVFEIRLSKQKQKCLLPRLVQLSGDKPLTSDLFILSCFIPSDKHKEKVTGHLDNLKNGLKK